jgi:hypothetical protein
MSFSLRKLEAQGARKTRPKHGAWAYLDKHHLPSGRAWKRVEAEISALRQALIVQYGGENIQPAVLALIESAIEGLTIQRLSSLYVNKAGIMRQDAIHRGDLQLHSVLSGQFISYANLVRLNLEAAARLAKGGRADNAPTPFEIAAEIDAAKEEAQAEVGNGSPKDEAGRGKIMRNNASQGRIRGSEGQGSEALPGVEPEPEEEA